MSEDVADIGPEDLRRFIAQRHERDYRLIDVRQPAEYALQHIPGAILLPLPELEQRLSDLPSTGDLVFYCRSGGRSEVAATLVSEAGIAAGKIYNLDGGISQWSGSTLPGVPRLALLAPSMALPELLYTAMDFERGAWRFYQELLPRIASKPAAEAFAALAGAEVGHARLVFALWAPTQEAPPPFETLFQSLPGAIIEGGLDLAETLKAAQMLAQGAGLRMLEFALRMELAAYDLYRIAAESAAPEARETLIAIAQAEKGHMRTLIAAIPRCQEDDAARP